MTRFNVNRQTLVVAVATVAILTLGGAAMASGPGHGKGMGMNPCAAAPKGMNPCAAAPKMMNPCAAAPKGANPCASQSSMSPKLFTRPVGTTLAKGNPADLIKEGRTLFMDKSLSTNGNSCSTCHAKFGMFSNTFAKPFPHKVEMAEDIGKKQIRLDEMIQLCMLAPMEAKTLPWESRQLAALTAYVGEVQKSFMARGRSTNPCAPAPSKGMNPCAR